MDETKGHFFSKEFCLFKGKAKRCNAFVSLTAGVIPPIIRKLVALAAMESETEDPLLELF